MDFMIDANYNVWLIEVNSNPCLELSCPLLGSIIPKMVENALEYLCPNSDSRWTACSRLPSGTTPKGSTTTKT
jgi:hypothetical protein